MCVPVVELVVNALRVSLILCVRQRLLLRREGYEENVAHLLVRIGYTEVRTVTTEQHRIARIDQAAAEVGALEKL